MTYYKEMNIGAYYITTHLRSDCTYVLTMTYKNHTIKDLYFIFYMKQVLKMDIDIGNFMPLDRMKPYTTNLYKKAYE